MRVVLWLLAALALFVGGTFALGRVGGVGPFALGVPGSSVFVLIARGSEENAAREVEVIDLASGQRQVFDLPTRGLELALSPDRRTLYAGSDRGVILELDAARGTRIGGLQLATAGEVQRLIATPDGRSLVAVTTAGLDSSVSVIDLGTGRERSSLGIGRVIVGTALLRGDALLLATSDRAGADGIVEVGLDPPTLRRQIPVSISLRGSLQTAPPTIAVAPDATLLMLSPYALRLFEVNGEGVRRRDLDLAAGFTRATGGPSLDGDVALSSDGRVIHACLGLNRAARYRIGREELAAERVADTCGRFVRTADGTLLLGLRAKPELHLLDQRSGALRRSLPLVGIPVRLVG